jgi:uncharacterized protein YbjT (DUF2867 family)
VDERPTIVVTGATGRVGGRVLAHLAGTGARVRAVARDPERLGAAAALHGAEPVVADLTDPASLAPAVAGADAVFLVFPSVSGDATAAQTVDALATGTQRIVYLSANGAQLARPDDGGIMGSHALLEQLIADAVPEWTFLRASGFAANTLGWAEQLRRGDVLRWIFPDAVRALVHEDDLAAVGSAALLDDGPAGLVGAAPHLSGPEQLSQAAMLELIGEATGRSLRFAEVPAEAAGELFPGAPDALVQAIVAGQRALVDTPESVSDDVEKVLGRPALTFGRWARDHADDFAAADPARAR